MHKKAILIFFATTFSGSLVTATPSIGIAIGAVTTSMFVIAARRATSKREWELFQIIPEIIDHVISGIQSGLSLNESLINLGSRGPAISQDLFQEFKKLMHSGESFEHGIQYLQNEFSLRSADQLFESLIFAKNLGGSDLLSLLRQLGDFTRQELSLRKEMAAKQQWVRNSAHLSAGAPWILLLLLSTQASTRTAFMTSQGTFVLLTGVAMTVIAYLWMGKLSQLPESKRIFGQQL
ncbi:TadB Flp pilus assembly protein TadB [Candidatus Nanopelagicaceae bacterium]